MRRSRAVLLLSMLWVTGCNFNPTPPATNTSVLTKGITLPPGTNAILAIKSTAGVSTVAAKASSVSAQIIGDTVTLDSALIVLKEIELRQACNAETGEEGLEFELEGPFLVDLVNNMVRNLGTSHIDDDADDDGVEDIDDDDDDNDGVPDDEDDDDDGDGIDDDDDQTMGETQLFDAVELPEGIYHRIEFKLDKLDAEDAPDSNPEMIGFSVRVMGSIMSADGMVSMEYCASFEEELKFRSNDGIVVEPGIVATFLLTVDPTGWFAGVNPADGMLTDGVLVICGDSNPDLAEVVRNNIHERGRLGHDDDGDGDDDDDEDGDLEDDDGSEDDDECHDDSTSPPPMDPPPSE